MVAWVWLQPIGNERKMLLRSDRPTGRRTRHHAVRTASDGLVQLPTPHRKPCRRPPIISPARRTLPVRVRKIGILYSPTAPFRAVTIAIENASDLREFRERLRDLTSAKDFNEPHISLLYTIGSDQNRTAWSGDEQRLRAIAAECETRLAASQFLLDDPVLVAPNGDRTNVVSWTVIRRFLDLSRKPVPPPCRAGRLFWAAPTTILAACR